MASQAPKSVDNVTVPAIGGAMDQDAQDLMLCRRGAANPADGSAGREALGRLYDRHGAVVRALCRGELSAAGEHDADDALQETFMRAWRVCGRAGTDGRDEVEADGSDGGVRRWLYAIARNVCAERRRAAARRGVHEREAAGLVPKRARKGEAVGVWIEAPGVMGGRGRTGEQGPMDAAEHNEQLEALTRALEELPDDERLAVHLYYLEGDPVAAAQASLRISRSGFYKLLTRARGRLSEQLSGALGMAGRPAGAPPRPETA